MSVSLGANGNSFNYPQTDDTAWGDDATNWASAVSAALSAIGLGGTLTANAVINLQSTTKGFLPPRMTTVQRDAIATPTEGLLIYNTTTDLLNVYNGSAWIQFPSSDALTTNRLLQYDGSKIVSSTVAMSGSDMTVSGAMNANSASIVGTAAATKVKTDDIEANTSAGLVVNTANGTDVARFGASNASTLEALGDIVANNKIRAQGTGGVLIEASDGTDVLLLGPANTANSTFYGTVNFNTAIGAPDGTVGTPGLNFKDDTNNGLYRIGADEWGLSANGVQQARVGTYGLYSAGHVLQVVSVAKTDTFSTSSTSYTDITGLSATITPKSTASQILVIATITGQHNTAPNGFRIVRDSTAIGIGAAASARTQATTASLYVGDSASMAMGLPIAFTDSPASVAALTYKIQAITSGGTLYINRNTSDSDSSSNYRTISSIILMEIGGV